MGFLRFVSVLIPLLTLAVPAVAKAPVWRWIGVSEGLDPESVTALAITEDGLVWIGSSTGVQRWDGRRVVRVDGGKIRGHVSRLVALPDGRVLARDATGRLWWIDNQRSRRLLGPDGKPATVLDVALHHDGSVLLVNDQGLFQRVDEAWRQLASAEALHTPTLARRGPGETLIVGTRDEGWWLWSPNAHRQLVSSGRRAADAAVAADGAIWLGDQRDVVRRIAPDGSLLGRWVGEGNIRSVARRGDDIWVSTGSTLRRFEPDREPQVLLEDFGIPSSGPLWVDRENNLWMGSFHGLGVLAEPDAVRFNARDGMPDAAVRFVSAGSEAIWIGTWKGAARLDRATETVRFIDRPLAKGKVCLDGAGWAWTVAEEETGELAFIAWTESGQQLRWPSPAASNHMEDCATDVTGRVWITAGNALYQAKGGEPQHVGPLPFSTLGLRVLYAKGSTLWAASGLEVCQMAPNSVEEWRCWSIDADGYINDLIRTEAGALWLVGINIGLWRIVDGEAQRHPASATLANDSLKALAPSARGGTWVLGDSTALRVRDENVGPEGWRVEERLGRWLGHLANSPLDLHEDADGTLWIASASGFAKVPAAARQPQPDPPPVQLTQMLVDGQPTQSAELPSSTSHVSFRYAAASHRAPQLLRFRARLDGGAWSAPSAEPIFGFSGLSGGLHRIEVQASLDEERWTATPHTQELRVPWPWYGRPRTWVFLGFCAAAALLLWLRVRHRFRLEVERLRTRIALDLHDEVGAGLASIGLLGGVLKNDLPREGRVDLACRIEDTSRELSDALRGIVWSLDPASLNVGALGAYLEQRANDILCGLDEDALEVECPDTAARTSLPLAVLRNTQLIAVEALHNVAKHAEAKRVMLTLQRAPHDLWELRIEDDGVGMNECRESRPGHGNGLQGMSSRADQIGGSLTIDTGPLGGTRVVLRFRAKSGFSWQ